MPRKTLRNNLKPFSYQIPVGLENNRPKELELDDYISILEAS